MSKKSSRKITNWRKKCVARAKKEALERDGYKCQKCGRGKSSGWQIHASHVFPEGTYRGMSADPLNIKALCFRCHFYWWHKNPIEAVEWFKKKFPDRYEYLLFQSKKTIKINWEKLYGNKLS